MSPRAKNIPINGLFLNEKAMQFAKNLGKKYFIPGNGWLQCFKDVVVIVFKYVSGESAQLNTSVNEEWLKRKKKN